MALVRLDARFDALDAVAHDANAHHVVVSVRDADTIIAVAALKDRVTGPLGVWLEISADYSAQIAARDVATLSWLVPLDCVVVSSPSATASAQVLEALLSDDEVNFTNGEATLVAAYNRPAPPTPIAVWSWDGATLRHGDEVLRESSSTSSDAGDLTTFR
jgi:hypothetical protein